MTNLQLATSALAHLRASSGYKATKRDNPRPASFAKTQAGQCEAELVQLVANLEAESTPAPPRPALAAQVQRVVFFANVTGDALAHLVALGPPWKAAFSADAGVYTPDPAEFAFCRSHGIPVFSWCDSRNAGEGTPFQAALDMRDKYGLDGAIGQAETPGELENSVGIDETGALVRPQGNERARLLIGNPNAWTQAQRTTATRMINQGDLAVTGECYTVKPDYSAGGVPIASITVGVAMDAGTYYPYTSYKAQMPAGLMATCGVWHGAGLQAEAWTAMGG